VSSGWWVVVRVRCPRCGHEWEYRGRGLYATCPRCYRKVSVERHRVGGARIDSTELGGAWLTVLKASDYEKVAPIVKRCIEEVGGWYREGEGGMDIDVPDDRARDFIECMKRNGVDLEFRRRRTRTSVS